MSSAIAETLTKELRAKTATGMVEWAEANGEFVVWPAGEPHQDAESVRVAIERMAAEDRFSQD